MTRLTRLAAGMAIVAASAAQAGPADYRFEAVAPEVAAAPAATIAVRLIHLPDRTPVKDAVLFQPRLEMPMAGMAPMTARVAAAPPDGTGVYPFTADLSMAGPWILSLSAKVQGETATLTGSVPFTAVAGGHAHGH